MSEWVKVGSEEHINAAIYEREYGPDVHGCIYIDRQMDWAWQITIAHEYTINCPLYHETPEAACAACDTAFLRFAAAVKDAADDVAPTGAGG